MGVKYRIPQDTQDVLSLMKDSETAYEYLTNSVKLIGKYRYEIHFSDGVGDAWVKDLKMQISYVRIYNHPSFISDFPLPDDPNVLKEIVEIQMDHDPYTFVVGGKTYEIKYFLSQDVNGQLVNAGVIIKEIKPKVIQTI